ncbi:P-loop containing nucleoside triphosphate hydrolase protein [Thelephora ganbajun]|uniref:P-loop containing nucleoside triphosphate hydrolase protein n=1 Tax=Thelephora ganbajun TaxID=370292 RepID=A0ACB6ZR51_THEGA|nr:P-loop containing nucleoside triphosphate hydrolase protein [Thelephora ganbajun]
MDSSLSTDSLADWFKLILIGNFLNTHVLSSIVGYAWGALMRRFYTTIEFDEFDSTFSWINVWLAQKPEWYTARDLSITTRSFGLETAASGQYGEYRDGSHCSEDLKVRKQPSFFVTTSFWYKSHYLCATRTRAQGTAHVGLQTLKIQIYGHNPKIVDELLADAERCWKEAKSEHITIYSSTTMNQWHQVASRPKRPLDSIVLDRGVKEDLLSDARTFLGSRSWYSERGIPFRRGYLLYGVPGSGKTSLIHSLAGELGLDVYMISLSRAGLDDTTLQELISYLPERCIALMEDIDAAFRHDINREPASIDPSHSHATFPGATTGIQSRGVTLSGLLNAIDGVAAHEGRLLFATTNHYESLDPALRRPGRMDRHIEFRLASRYQIAEMFRRFYASTVSGSFPPCLEKPTSLYTDEEDEKNSVGDCSFWSPNSTAVSLIDIDTDVPMSRTISSESSNHELVIADPDKLKVWQAAGLDDQARKFASFVPERFISMAELQGYLMLHRSDPVSAIASVRRFIVNKENRGGLIRS